MPGPAFGRLRKEILALGYKSVRYWSYRHLVDDASADPAVCFGGFSSFFYVELKPPFPWAWAPGERWGPAPVGSGILWGPQTPAHLWGFTGAEVWQFDELRAVIAKWKPAGSSCRFVEIILRVNIFGIPTEIRRLPVHEDWEIDSNGGARDFYNHSYTQEHV